MISATVDETEMAAFMRRVADAAGDARPWEQIIADPNYGETTGWIRTALVELLAQRAARIGALATHSPMLGPKGRCGICGILDGVYVRRDDVLDSLAGGRP